jgi:ribonuclease-3
LLNGLLAGIGTGFSKKESQQQAAQMALKKIKSDEEFIQKVLQSYS